MFRYSLSWYIFTFTLLESIIKTHLTLHDSSHGFISNNQRYFDNDLSVIHEEITSGLRSARINDATLQLKFEPAFLDFKLRQLGVPHLEKVTLFNVDSNRSIDMTSISGSTVHFHSSFFENKKIPPLGNTSFNVVFLGREEGFVESSLFIHTTEGHFRYNVKGSSIYSPYRLRPIVAIKLPINASFSPLIYMHNPHAEPIQIVEVYSSGGDFHLELPSGELEGPKDIWEIAPLATKAVIRVRFHAKSEQNHTAYVRIKINSTDEILVVPLEVEVSAGGGIYDPQGSVDFGVGGSLESPKVVDLCVLNPLKKVVRIQSVVSSLTAVSVNYESVKLLPASGGGCVKIGTLSLDWKAAFDIGEYAGKVTIKYKNGRISEVPFYLTVLEGGLTYDPLSTRYFTNDKSNIPNSRIFKLKNSFQTAVKVLNYTLPQEVTNFFKIDNFKAQTIKPQQEANIFNLKLKPGIVLSELKVNSFIALRTNVSDLVIPLLSYNGRLQVQLPFKSKDYSLDLGLIGFDTKKDVYFLISNQNPVNIHVKNLKTSIPMTTAAVLVGCGRGDRDSALLQVSFRNLTKCTQLKPDEYAIIRLSVHTGNNEGQSWGDIQIETPYEHLFLPVHFKVANGKLEIGPDRLVFDQCFPGKICSHPLRVHSTFDEPMLIDDILSMPPDRRISSQHSGHILARATKIIGNLYLDPTLDCGLECYTGLQHDTTAQWLKTLSLAKSVSDFDLNLVNVFYNRYLNATSNGLKNWQNLTLRLDTSEVRGHIFRTRVKMSWPSLLTGQNHENRSILRFPLTQIGNTTYQNITIRNPSSYNLVVQICLDKHYPEIGEIFEGLPASFIPSNHESATNHGFFLALDGDSHFSFDVDVHNESIPVLLRPGANFTFNVGFRTANTTPHSALILLRNNLTIVEVVQLRAQGAQPMFKFGNRRPGSELALTFELTDRHLKDCQREKQFRHPSPNLTVKRSFTARNIGEVTIYINRLLINHLPCEGYGFKVLNCGAFVLHPNGTKKIEIAFTPDLTLSKVSRSLVMETSLNFPVEYTLYTTIPPFYLSLCSNLIARPNWEPYLGFCCMCTMFTMFIVISLIAFLDSDRIKRQAIASLMTPSNLSVQPVLDLRLVGQQTRVEIRSVPPVVAPVKEDEKVERRDEVKAPILVPITGKSKRKLAKKNSGDGEEAQKEEAQSQSKQKKKEEKKIKKAVVVVVPPPVVVCKKVTKNFVPVCEEETSSTTTDCSSNNEESEPPPQIEQKRTCSINTINNNTNLITNNNKMNKMEEKPVEAKPVLPTAVTGQAQRKKSQPRSSLPNANKSEVVKLEKPPKTNKHRKRDHQTKHKNVSVAKCDKRESPPIRASPPIASPNLWTENRATFSDVVARSEQPSLVNIVNARPLSQKATSKPTMYVEPYKQAPAELGPIGSRRSDYWPEEAAADESHSFFTNAFDLSPQAAEPPWASSPAAARQPVWPAGAAQQSNAYWNSVYRPFAEGLQRAQGEGGAAHGYLWGASPVWQPWAPGEMPKTPTRTPPGFDAYPQRKRDDSPVQQQRDTYSPFGTSNIWTQPHQENPWNYQSQ